MSPLPEVAGVEFRLIPGFTCYAVGNDGSVWSNCRVGNKNLIGWRPVTQYRRPYGARYFVVSLRDDDGRGKVVCRYVHRLVLEAFSGSPAEGMVGRHLDGNTANNRADNLAWGTVAENAADKVIHGTRLSGERSALSRLTVVQVREIRARRSAGEQSKEIAACYGVSVGTVNDIVARRRWKHDG